MYRSCNYRGIGVVTRSGNNLSYHCTVTRLSINRCITSLAAVDAPRENYRCTSCLLGGLPGHFRGVIRFACGAALEHLKSGGPSFVSTIDGLATSFYSRFSGGAPAPSCVCARDMNSLVPGGTVVGSPLDFATFFVGGSSNAGSKLINGNSFR